MRQRDSHAVMDHRPCLREVNAGVVAEEEHMNERVV